MNKEKIQERVDALDYTDCGIAIEYNLEDRMLDYSYGGRRTAFGDVVFKTHHLADKAMSQLTEQDIKDYFLWQEGADDE